MAFDQDELKQLQQLFQKNNQELKEYIQENNQELKDYIQAQDQQIARDLKEYIQENNQEIIRGISEVVENEYATKQELRDSESELNSRIDRIQNKLSLAS